MHLLITCAILWCKSAENTFKHPNFINKIRTRHFMKQSVNINETRYYMFNIHQNNSTHTVRQESSCTSDNQGDSHGSMCPDDQLRQDSIQSQCLSDSPDVRIFQPSFHASSSRSENSSVDFCLWNSSANATQIKTAFIQSAIRGSVFMFKLLLLTKTIKITCNKH